MNTLFICYDSHDVSFAHKLVSDLDQQGVRTWFAARDLSKGSVREVEVQKAIKNSKHLLVLLSKNSTNSDQFLFELAYSRVDKKEAIPILMEDCEIPTQLRDVKAIDFRVNYESALKKLLDLLSSIAHADLSVGYDKIQTSGKDQVVKVETNITHAPNKVIDRRKHIELNDSAVHGDVFIGKKTMDKDGPAHVFPAKPIVQIITISIGLLGIGFPIWWFLNNSSKDVLDYLLPLLIVVLSILITLMGVIAPEQLVKILLAVLGAKNDKTDAP